MQKLLPIYIAIISVTISLFIFMKSQKDEKFRTALKNSKRLQVILVSSGIILAVVIWASLFYLK